MSKLKRLPVKYIRDLIKRDYIYDTSCYICGAKEQLELHHIYSLSQLWQNWCDKHKIDKIDSIEEIMDLRVSFQNENQAELNNDNLYTLCNEHHKRLHSLYGQTYSNVMVPKILRWLGIQRDKYGNN